MSKTPIAVPVDTDETAMRELRTSGFIPIKTASPEGLRLMEGSAIKPVIMMAALEALANSSDTDTTDEFVVSLHAAMKQHEAKTGSQQ